MADIVLVHGAFHGGWCWRDVAEPLRREGHVVHAPSLTGLGDRSHLLSSAVDLDTHIADIRNLIETEELADVVLVGHSYGGLPITGAADALAGRVAALVYLDALIPDDGDSVMSIRARESGASLTITLAEGEIAVPPPPSSVFGLAGDLEAWADRRLTPHPHATLEQPIRLNGAWRGVARKVFIRCTRYVSPHLDRSHEAAAGEDSWVTIRRDAAHNIMMTEPDRFLDILRTHAL